MVGLENLAPDQKLFLKLCTRLRLLTEIEIEQFLSENSEVKEVSLALLQNNLIDLEGLKKAIDLMNISSLCPYCDKINIYQERTGEEDICRHCHNSYSYRSSTSSRNAIKINYGNYKILEEIGRGSMGIVYKAKHSTLDRYSALKILKMNKQDETGLLRFKSEAKAIAVLNHPNIVAIYDTGMQNGQYYIAMEYIDGESLIDFMKKKISIKRKVEIIIQIAYALQHAHENKIIHRDIKPENIMLTKEGQVKITDFGLARSLKQKSNITQENFVIGTPLYMSPEQVRGEELTGSTDIYSLGVVLYEFLTGRTPFFDIQSEKVMRKILSDSPIPPNTARPEINYTLSQICMKAMEKNKLHRFSTAKDMALSLENCLKGFGKIFQEKKPDLPFMENREAASQVISCEKIANLPPEKFAKSSSHARKVIDFEEERTIPQKKVRKVYEEELDLEKEIPQKKVREDFAVEKEIPQKKARKVYEEELDLEKEIPQKKIRKIYEEEDFEEEQELENYSTNLLAKEKKGYDWSLYDLFSWILLFVFFIVLFYKIVHFILVQIKAS